MSLKKFGIALMLLSNYAFSESYSCEVLDIKELSPNGMFADTEFTETIQKGLKHFVVNKETGKIQGDKDFYLEIEEVIDAGYNSGFKAVTIVKNLTTTFGSVQLLNIESNIPAREKPFYLINAKILTTGICTES